MKTFFAIPALALFAAACGDGDGNGNGGTPAPCSTAPAGTPITAITAQDNQFVPACAKVSANTPITFTNAGINPHTVTDADPPVDFNASLPSNGTTFQPTFATTGVVHVQCTIHPGMTVTIFVE